MGVLKSGDLRGFLKKVLRLLLAVVLIVVIAFAGLVAYLAVTEYKPADREELGIDAGTVQKSLKSGDELSILTWNIGYGALGDNADFFMDGGKGVQTAEEDRVHANLTHAAAAMSGLDPDVIFLQEIDQSSKRSYFLNEVEYVKNTLSAVLGDYDSTFANNFKVAFLPYPIPPIGKVDSGIATLSAYPIDEAERYKLPCPFKWPVRMANLKRCLMVDRVSVTDEQGNDTGKDLVLVNLHLEAYDSGEGKIAQTNMLRQILQDEADKGNYVIAGGDFNQTFSGTDDSMYPEYEGKWHCGEIDESEFDDSWQFVMDNRLPTCRSLDRPYAGTDHDDFQYYVIDGFIVSSNVTVESIKTQNYDFVYSDHNPVLMKVKLD